MVAPCTDRLSSSSQIGLFASLSLLLLGACWQSSSRELTGLETATPSDFRFVGRMMPCYIEVQDIQPRAIRVNCFHIDGTLHIHSNRFANIPRFKGESWVKSVRRDPQVRVAIADNIYRMRAVAIDDPHIRAAILHDRGYPYAWKGITIFRFYPAEMQNSRVVFANSTSSTTGAWFG